jgi:hypothetical protein
MRSTEAALPVSPDLLRLKPHTEGAKEGNILSSAIQSLIKAAIQECMLSYG